MLKTLISDSKIDNLKMIKDAIKVVSDDKTKACARNGREAIEK